MAGVPGSSGVLWMAEIPAPLQVLRAFGVHAGVDESVSTVALGFEIASARRTVEYVASLRPASVISPVTRRLTRQRLTGFDP